MMKKPKLIIIISSIAMLASLIMAGCDPLKDAEWTLDHSHTWSSGTAANSTKWIPPTETTDGYQGRFCTECGELRDDAYVFPSWNHLYGTWKDSTGRDEIVLSATEYKYTIGKAAPDSAGFLTIAPLTFTPVYNTLDLTKANYILGYDVKGKYTAVNANFPAQVVGEDSTVRLLFDKTSRTKLSYGGADGPTFRYEKQP